MIDGMPEKEFVVRALGFHKIMLSMEVPQASVGYCWSSAAASVDRLVRIAEERMYEDKHEFYKHHPEMKR